MSENPDPATPEPGEPRSAGALPDRLATNPKSRWYDATLLERGVGIRFNGKEQTQIEEYCVSEGWVRLAVGKSLDRHGNAMTIKLKGTVEPYLLDAKQGDAPH